MRRSQYTQPACSIRLLNWCWSCDDQKASDRQWSLPIVWDKKKQPTESKLLIGWAQNCCHVTINKRQTFDQQPTSNQVLTSTKTSNQGRHQTKFQFNTKIHCLFYVYIVCVFVIDEMHSYNSAVIIDRCVMEEQHSYSC